jgi:carboxypeptidase D
VRAGSRVGGLVRQHGGLSFTRVFQAGTLFTPKAQMPKTNRPAGHAVPWYQPETAYEIFRRVTGGLDVATGRAAASATYASAGATNALVSSGPLPAMPAPQCYLLALTPTCPREIEQKLRRGQGRIRDYIVT